MLDSSNTVYGQKYWREEYLVISANFNFGSLYFGDGLLVGYNYNHSL